MNEFSNENQNNNVNELNNQYQNNNMNQINNNKLKKIIIIAGIVLVVIIAALIILIATLKGENNPSGNNGNNTNSNNTNNNSSSVNNGITENVISADELKKNIEILKVEKTNNGEYPDHLIFHIKNNNSVDVNITFYINLYDASGNKIPGIFPTREFYNEYLIIAVGPQEEIIWTVDLNSESAKTYDRYEIDYEVKKSVGLMNGNDSFEIISEEITKYNGANNSVIIKLKNKGDIKIDLRFDIIFYKNGEVIYTNYHSAPGLKPEETNESNKICMRGDFDSYKIYYHAYVDI